MLNQDPILGVRQWVTHVTKADNLRTQQALEAATHRSNLAHQLALKWGRHWLATVRTRKQQGRMRCNKENRSEHRGGVVSWPREKKLDMPVHLPNNFYAEFKVLREQRPVPKIPSFLLTQKRT